jgi:hypothetical protein
MTTTSKGEVSMDIKIGDRVVIHNPDFQDHRASGVVVDIYPPEKYNGRTIAVDLELISEQHTRYTIPGLYTPEQIRIHE